MRFSGGRRTFLGVVGAALAWLAVPGWGQVRNGGDQSGGGQNGGGQGGGGGGGRGRNRDDYFLPEDLAAFAAVSVVLGRATDKAVTVSIVAKDASEAYIEFGTSPGHYTRKTPVAPLPPGEPVEVVLEGLRANTSYVYRLQHRKPGTEAFTPRTEARFHTQRAAGSTFTVVVQGDSHPERPQMSDPTLYARTLQHAAAANPDLYICMGDDFSIDTLRSYTADAVASRYTLQRPFMGLVAQSAPIFLLNGNHEQASLANYNQKGLPHDAAVWAQLARNKFFPTIAPDAFGGQQRRRRREVRRHREVTCTTPPGKKLVSLAPCLHGVGPPTTENPRVGAPGFDGATARISPTPGKPGANSRRLPGVMLRKR